MAAHDFNICNGMITVSIAKKSKKDPNSMTDDRRVLTPHEIASVISSQLEDLLQRHEGSFGFKVDLSDGRTIFVRYVEKDKMRTITKSK